MTPHPGTVKARVPITLPRPRDPLSMDFLAFQKELLRQLGHGAQITGANQDSMKEGER
jgi:hypothetical protein